MLRREGTDVDGRWSDERYRDNDAEPADDRRMSLQADVIPANSSAARQRPRTAFVSKEI